MNENTIEMVQKSWAKVIPSVDAVGQIFYDNLFEMDPKLRSMFKGDVKAQSRKLMQMVSIAVSKLRSLDALVPVLQDLGVKHIEYGVQPAHYDTVAAALLKTLDAGLGDAFTPQLKAAWVDVYSLVAGTMIDAAEHSQTNVA